MIIGHVTAQSQCEYATSAFTLQTLEWSITISPPRSMKCGFLPLRRLTPLNGHRPCHRLGTVFAAHRLTDAGKPPSKGHPCFPYGEAKFMLIFNIYFLRECENMHINKFEWGKFSFLQPQIFFRKLTVSPKKVRPHRISTGRGPKTFGPQCNTMAMMIIRRRQKKYIFVAFNSTAWM